MRCPHFYRHHSDKGLTYRYCRHHSLHPSCSSCRLASTDRLHSRKCPAYNCRYPRNLRLPCRHIREPVCTHRSSRYKHRLCMSSRRRTPYWCCSRPQSRCFCMRGRSRGHPCRHCCHHSLLNRRNSSHPVSFHRYWLWCYRHQSYRRCRRSN